jgi:3-deoxy-D-manno-octulosonic-acid transferase
VDTMGELEVLFGSAAVVFLGGSLAPVGGHNVLEPALAGCPVLVGPHLETCRAEAELLAAAGGLQVVHDAKELGEALAALLADENGRRERGARGRAAAAGLRGAAAAHVELLRAAGILDARA